MKIKLSILVFLFVSAMALVAQPIPQPLPPGFTPQRTASQSLGWFAPTNYVNTSAPLFVTNIVNYRLYHGTNSGLFYEYVLLPGGTNTYYRWTGLRPGTSNYFVVSAINRDGTESDYSPVFILQTEPQIAAPQMIIPLTNTVQAANSPDGPWETLSTQVLWAVADQPNRNFRSVVEQGKPFPAVR